MIADQTGKCLRDKRSFALLKRYLGISKGETEKAYAVLVKGQQITRHLEFTRGNDEQWKYLKQNPLEN